MKTVVLRAWWRGVGAFSVIGLTLLFSSLRAPQNTGELDVGVRTIIEPDAKFDKKVKGKPVPPRPRLYAMLQVQQRTSFDKLVKPVDAEMMALEVARQLDLQGFKRVQPKQKPEIVITAEYGRGMLPNPYMGDPAIESLDNGVPTVTHGADALKQLMRQRAPGFEAKLQKASYEKLFIEVKAWKYPASPGEKPRVMWVALMNVDDPDHRDLNGVFKEMLAAGAPYFDSQVEGEEVDVFKPLPEGNVKVGTPTEVVEPAKPAGK